MRSTRARSVLAALLAALTLSTSCAVTSTLTLPPCVDRLAVEGEHRRVGRTLTFDHSLDAPGTRTDIVVGEGAGAQTVSLWNHQPDGGRLFAGILTIVGGGALLTVAGYELQNGGSFGDEVPFYGAAFGSVAVVVGAGLALTGWHPKAPPNLEGVCRDGAPR